MEYASEPNALKTVLFVESIQTTVTHAQTHLNFLFMENVLLTAKKELTRKITNVLHVLSSVRLVKKRQLSVHLARILEQPF